MRRDKLAILGGPKLRMRPFPPYPHIEEDDRQAILEVLNEGRLSTFIAEPGESFLGGRRIREFERAFAIYHNARFAVAFNSCTAALHAAIVAMGVGLGEEVIVPPYTFTSTATCALMQGAVPVFADVESETFCLDPKAVEKTISSLTRVIIPVHLFGHPAPMDEILSLAKRYHLKVIEDCAQAPGAGYRKQKVGTLGDCGVFSFQESKNMITGEGGMLITNDGDIAETACLVRNHGEAVVHSEKKRTYRSDLLGWNYRMTEFEAALGIVQLSRLELQNQKRRSLSEHLTKQLVGIDGLRIPRVREGCDHVYYVYPLLVDEAQLGLSRDLFVKALRAEGIPVGAGYIKPLYFSPIYQERQTFAYRFYQGKVSYDAGICPVAEHLYSQSVLIIPVCRPPAEKSDIDDIAAAIQKVLSAKKDLQETGD